MFRWWEQIVTQHCRRGQLCTENRQWVITLFHSQALFQYCIVIIVSSPILFLLCVCLLFQEGQSSQNHTASPLPHPPPPPTRPKKWAGRLWNVSIVITLKFKTPALSQLYLLCVCLPQCVWSRGWYVVSQWQWQRQWQWRVGRHGAKAGRETQGADEGSDFAEDLCHAGPQSHDREAGEGGRRVRINREVLLPKKDKEQVKACKY